MKRIAAGGAIATLIFVGAGLAGPASAVLPGGSGQKSEQPSPSAQRGQPSMLRGGASPSVESLEAEEAWQEAPIAFVAWLESEYGPEKGYVSASLEYGERAVIVGWYKGADLPLDFYERAEGRGFSVDLRLIDSDPVAVPRTTEQVFSLLADKYPEFRINSVRPPGLRGDGYEIRGTLDSGASMAEFERTVSDDPDFSDLGYSFSFVEDDNYLVPTSLTVRTSEVAGIDAASAPSPK